MSEQLKETDNDNFMPHGFDGNPSLFGEQQMAHDYGQMADAVLVDKVQRFIAIMNDPDTLPHHRMQYAKLVDYIAFEFACRDAERKHTFGHRVLESLGVEEPQL